MVIRRIKESDTINGTLNDGTRISRPDLVRFNVIELRSDNGDRVTREDVSNVATETIGNNLPESEPGGGPAAADVDIFDVDLNKGDTLQIDINNIPRGNRPAREAKPGSSSRSVDHLVRIFTRDKNDSDNDGDIRDFIEVKRSTEDSFEFTAEQNGPFFIGVSARRNGSYNPNRIIYNNSERREPNPNNNSNATGQYELELRLQDPPEFSISDTVISESDGSAALTVSLSKPSTITQSVIISTTDDSAIAGSDYIAIPPTKITFEPGETTKTVPLPPITILNDNVVELDEQFFVNLSNPSEGTTINKVQGTVIIQNDDSAVISVNANSVVEGDSGKTFAPVDFSLNNPVDIDIAVRYQTFNGIATVADVDYDGVGPNEVNPPGFVFFDAGTTTPNLTKSTGSTPPDPSNASNQLGVNLNGDTNVEPDETYGVLLTAPDVGGRNVSLGAPSTGVIINDDVLPPPPPPAFSINDVTVTEGVDLDATFTITRSSDTSQENSIDISTADGTAIAGSDYGALLGPLTFAPGETIKTWAVPIIDDNVYEPTENFFVNLSNPTGGAIIDDPQGEGIIIDNEPFPKVTLGIDVDTIPEDGGQAVITATLDTPTSSNVIVNLGFTGDATLGDDYTTPTTIDISAGELTGTSDLIAVNDLIDETPGELATVFIDTVTNAMEDGEQEVSVFITDDDAPPPPAPSIEIDHQVNADGIDGFADKENGFAGGDAEFQTSITNTGNVDLVIDKIEASPSTTLPTDIAPNTSGIALAPGETTTIPYPLVTLPNPGRDTKPPIEGTPEDDMLFGEQRTEINGVTITASDSNGNSVVATDDAEVMFGIADIIAGGLGDDRIFGGGGDDLLRGDLNERADGSAYAGGDDFIDGGSGNDLMSGKSGNDTLLGGTGDDRIWGDDGDDLINGGAGADELYGDSRRGGADTFVLAVGEGGDTIMDYNFGGIIDTIQVLGATSVESVRNGSDTLIQADGELLATLSGYVGEVTFA